MQSPTKRPRPSTKLLLRDPFPPGGDHLLAGFILAGRHDPALRLARKLEFRIPELDEMIDQVYKADGGSRLVPRDDSHWTRLRAAAIHAVSEALDPAEFAAIVDTEGMELTPAPLSAREQASTDYAAAVASVTVCLMGELGDDDLPDVLPGLWRPAEDLSGLAAAKVLAEDLGMVHALATSAVLVTADNDRTMIRIGYDGAVTADDAPRPSSPRTRQATGPSPCAAETGAWCA